jgi:hypothetical protein
VGDDDSDAIARAPPAPARVRAPGGGGPLLLDLRLSLTGAAHRPPRHASAHVPRRVLDCRTSTPAQPTESTVHHHGRKFDFDAADELFRSSFGDVVWEQWRPGKTVSGTIRRDGKVFSITVSADGSSEEKEQDSENGDGRYAFIKSTGGDGGVSYQLSIDGGSLGEVLSELMVPGWLRMLPAVGMVVVAIVSWLPTICLGFCVLKCCFK